MTSNDSSSYFVTVPDRSAERPAAAAPTPSRPDQAATRKHPVSTLRVWLVVLGIVSVGWLTPFHPLTWAWVAALFGAAALPEGRAATILRKTVLVLTLGAMTLGVLAVGALILCFTVMGGQIG